MSVTMITYRGLCSVFFIIVCSILVSCQEADVTFSQPEEQVSGAFVGSVATSPSILNMVGEEDRKSLQYSILSQGFENSKYFRIDRNSGNITFNGTVDREVICQFSDTCDISFDVAVRGNNNFFSTIVVKIIITDRNDNSPRFPEASITLHISESANPSDFSVPIFTATDADRSENFGVSSYAINPENPVFDLEFSRNLLGTPQVSLTLKQKLNRESEASYNLIVVAEDGGSPPRNGYLNVEIVVDDYNDNEPIFSETFYTANFSENAGQGYEIIRVSAHDIDLGDNAVVSYALSAIPDANADLQNKLAVNSSTGIVSLIQPLTSGEYDILIDAYDHGKPPKSSQAVIRITVLDTDNNKPAITVNALQLGDLPPGFVSEAHESGTVVAVLNVNDPDSGKNGNVTCETSSVFFQLQQLQKNSFKLMVAARLNREVNATHTVTVSCKDQGSPSLNETVAIQIKVADENDNSPVFSRPSYQQKIVENNLVGDTVIVVNAMDNDDGQNAEIEFRLKGEGGNFTITPDTGIIRAKIRLNREEKSKYEFVVQAIDKGSYRRTSEVSVVVTVIDINDVKPKFSRESYTFPFYENRNRDSIIGNISVSDPDENEGGIVSLSLEPTTEGETVPFAIDNQGRISSLEKFDRETKQRYDFYVIARDNGQTRLSSSVPVTVNILDLNDNSPTFVFPSEQNFSTFVNIPIERDDVIMKVDVIDEDENKNQIITYEISTPSNGTDLFRIGKFSGEIIANKKLGLKDRGVYFIAVNATDRGYPTLWDARTLRLVVQSESASKDEVMADQNVLIVACIVCFTIIVSGAVLVAMCVLRRLDRQKKLQYASACCPDRGPDSDIGSITDNHQQYDLSTSKPNDTSMRPEKDSTYHQRHQNPQGGSSQGSTSDDTTNISHIFMDSSNGRGTNSSYQAGPPFYSMGQGTKVPESSLQRQDDFHSTSSAETVTGDSGHGSDEDLSNSMDHSNTPSTIMEHPLKSASGSLRAIPLSGYNNHPNMNSKQLHTIQKPSVSKSSTPRGKVNSVRFDPHVTDIYDNNACAPHNPHYTMNPPSYNDAHANPNLRSNQKQAHNPPLLPPQQQQQQQLRQKQWHEDALLLHQRRSSQRDKVHPMFSDAGHHHQFPNSEPQQLLIIKGRTKSHPVQPSSPRRLLSLSHASSLNDDDSDLNTTTSGSYSVASDDVGRVSSLLEVNDLYV